MDVFPHHNKYNNMAIGIRMRRLRAKYAEANRRAKQMYRANVRRDYMLSNEKTEVIELLIQMDIELDLHHKYLRSEWDYLTDIKYK